MLSSTYVDPCSSIQSYSNSNSYYQPASCYRPLQQLYKTVYAPVCGNNTTAMNIACICRPAERYKTTNMTYGSFYYDNTLSTEKNQVINYDKAIFARCYDNNGNRSGYQTSDKSRTRNTSMFSNSNDPQEMQYWTQSTSEACCPIDCCTNTFTAEHCLSNPKNSSYYSTASKNPSTAANDSSNVQVRCV